MTFVGCLGVDVFENLYSSIFEISTNSFMYTNAHIQTSPTHVGNWRGKSHFPPKDVVFYTKNPDEGTY